MKKKVVWIVVGAILLLAVFGFVFRKGLIRSYVKVNHDRLEQFAEELISGERTDRSYGLWQVDCYPEQGVVEFTTGGFGLTPGSNYEGFYYASSNAHCSAFGSGLPVRVDGDHAAWSEAGTDNRGTSIRITECWFWFEAWF